MEIRSIRFRQSGGFAGLVRGCEVAGNELSAEHRQALERYIEARRTAASAASGARDLIVYELEVETEAGKVRLEFDEAGAPDGLASLVDDLAARSRPIRP